MSLGPRHHHAEFPASRLVDLRQASRSDARPEGPTISVCLPARNEAGTVGDIVSAIRAELVEDAAVIDEILVIDDHSADDTAAVAATAGATVWQAASILPTYGEGPGKGEALWKSLWASTGDLVVWCDADIVAFSTRFVRGVIGTLLVDSNVSFVKGFYARPADGERGGGRVTELVAKPILSVFFPELSGLEQPLSGEFGGRREILEAVPFVEGYGVDIALVIDIAQKFGPASIAQVDLDERIDRNRTLDELGPQALAVLLAALRRSSADVPESVVLDRPPHQPVAVGVRERPPIHTLRSVNP